MAWCDVCDRNFGSSQAFWQHVDNSVRHECQCCYFHFASKEEELDHLNEDHVQCGICNDWLADNDALHAHRLREHANRYCAPCRRIFIGSSNLQSVPSLSSLSTSG